MTFGLFLARKVSLLRALFYMIAQCLGAICGVGLVKAFMKHFYNGLGGGANSVQPGYSKGTALGAEIIGTFVLVYTVFSATDPKRSARDSHVPVCFWFFLLVTRIILVVVPYVVNFFAEYEILCVCGWCLDVKRVGIGSSSYWVCCFHGSLGHHPHHRYWYQPSQELRRCCYL